MELFSLDNFALFMARKWLAEGSKYFGEGAPKIQILTPLIVNGPEFDQPQVYSVYSANIDILVKKTSPN